MPEAQQFHVGASPKSASRQQRPAKTSRYVGHLSCEDLHVKIYEPDTHPLFNSGAVVLILTISTLICFQTVDSDTILNDGADHSQNGGASYDELKAAARRTGDAAKEWMTGASCSGSSVYKAARSDSENLFESTKRAVEEGFGPSARESGKSPTDSNAGVMDKIKSEAEESIHTAKEKLQGAVSTTAEAVQHGIEVVKDQVSQAVVLPSKQTGPSDKQSARAEWERTRPADQQAEENADRKSQLTDAAHGDEPEEAVRRKDKQVTPEQFYTRH